MEDYKYPEASSGSVPGPFLDLSNKTLSVQKQNLLMRITGWIFGGEIGCGLTITTKKGTRGEAPWIASTDY
ncbi:uncharacterized protein Dvar_83080 [Desulfosarcina variabilis str. Montpellier]